MKKLVAAAAVLLLAGCASTPSPSITHKRKPAVVKVVPIEQPAVTPNQVVRKRWYDRFKVHPKWFRG